MTLPELIRWYYQVRNDASAPGVDFLDSTGRVYAETCACGYRARHQNAMKVYVCAGCGEQWKYEDCYMLKGEVQTSPRAGAFENQNARMVQVGYVLDRQLAEPRWKWDTRIYIATVMGHPINDRFAPAFKETFIDAPGPWSRRSLFDRARRAKEELTGRMAEAEVGFGT
jgi:hypothetical protein